MHHTWDIKNQNSCEDPKTLPFLHFFNIDKLKNFLKRLGCENCMVFVTAFFPCYQMYFPLKSGTPAIKEKEQHWETIGG